MIALLQRNYYGYPLSELYGETYTQAMRMVEDGELVYDEANDKLFLPLFG